MLKTPSPTKDADKIRADQSDDCKTNQGGKRPVGSPLGRHNFALMSDSRDGIAQELPSHRTGSQHRQSGPDDSSRNELQRR